MREIVAAKHIDEDKLESENSDEEENYAAIGGGKIIISSLLSSP